MPFAPYGKHEVEYTVAGQGKGLLMVHGMGQTGELSWGKIAPRLAEKRQVVCPNYTDFAETKEVGGTSPVARFADQMLAAADHAGLDRFDVAGVSFGTCIAMYLAAKHPDRVTGVVLLAGFMSTLDTRIQLQFRMWDELARSNPEMLAALSFYSTFTPAFLQGLSERQIESMIEGFCEGMRAAGPGGVIDLDLKFDVSEQAASIRQPALVIGCLQDYIIPVSHSKQLAETIPNAVYGEIDSGHAANLEQPGEVVRLFEEFLRD